MQHSTRTIACSIIAGLASPRPAALQSLQSLEKSPGENRQHSAQLREAAETIDPDSIRFAPRHVLRRGRTGAICAADGRQLLGLSLPWQDDMLMPGTQIVRCRDLPQDAPIPIGRNLRF